jgi:hypothetical protein
MKRAEIQRNGKFHGHDEIEPVAAEDPRDAGRGIGPFHGREHFLIECIRSGTPSNGAANAWRCLMVNRKEAVPQSLVRGEGWQFGGALISVQIVPYRRDILNPERDSSSLRCIWGLAHAHKNSHRGHVH